MKSQFLKCTCRDAMLPGEKIVTFRVTKHAMKPYRGKDENTFCWLVQENQLVAEGSAALMRISPRFFIDSEAAITLDMYGEPVWCYVPVEDIVEKEEGE
ncbi:MAG: hypothetical protein PHO02_05240 [Candidatus Nanoarchaeia archaeon]|nr:hypothetical protein [Candidatus Nanoarchaeia archaeon]